MDYDIPFDFLGFDENFGLVCFGYTKICGQQCIIYIWFYVL